MNWTREQQEAICCRDKKNILLAAAAGSGKTAVLVERVIKRIKDTQNPLSVSDLLVLTFTEAAAAEMKRKIMSAIKKELELNPHNQHLKKQSILLHSASISTVHAFCNKILKGNIHLTDFPVDYSLASKDEADFILKKAMDKTLEKYYSKIHLLPSFKELSLAYGGAKDDSNLRKLLFELYLFSRSLPYPKEWLRNSVETYKIFAEEKSFENTPWDSLKENFEETCILDILSCYDSILNIVSSLPDDHKYQGFYHAEADLVREALEKFQKGDTFSLLGFKLPTKVQKPKTHPEEEFSADTIRDLAKKILTELQDFLKSDTKESKELSKKLYFRARTLKNLILSIDRNYKKFKKERGLIDFSDLEHGLLNLISDKDHSPTPIALELRKRYAEILLDEYQDTNNIQEEIFRLLSNDNKNIFMVGDLKQCIYKFRNAAPELFAAKRQSYMENEEDGRLINLSKNFRSRKEIIETVNFIFSSVMSEKLGDIDYDEKEFLTLGAQYPKAKSGYETEFYLINEDDTLSPEEAEAGFIASQIEEIIKDGLLIYDSKKDVQKKAQYQDIVILLRDRKYAPVIESALEKRGIPVYSDSGTGYLSSVEVSTVLAFLNIIDNPYQDIPLIAVLRSKMFSFTADELSMIRLKNKNCWFYDALVMAAEEGFEKAADFLRELENLRKAAASQSIYRLILTIYERFHYPKLLGLMNNAELRRANLSLLAQRALEFEQSKETGLFAFMNYIENLKDEGKDMTAAKTVSEGENVVRLMTIHKSKGLEFPIVFLADTAHKFNTKDISKAINYHPQAGISLSAVDTVDRIKYPSLWTSLFKEIQKKELLSEEIRLLYVALTRAKEKLIITSTSASVPMYDSHKKPLCAYLKRCNSFSGWIVASLLPHPQAKNLRQHLGFDEDIVSTKANFPLKTDVIDFSEKACDTVKNQEEISENLLADEKKAFSFEDILSFKPQREYTVPVKITVTELKRRINEEYEYTPRLLSSRNIYLKKKEELSAAERGTVTHFILQHLDEKEIKSEADLIFALDKAEENGIISTEQRKTVDVSKLMKFYSSELGKRLKESKKVYKEYSFYSKVKAGEAFKDIAFDAYDIEVLLQGTIDCFFEESDGKMVLLDYKTDNITEAEAEDRAKKYKVQIECYNKALKTIFEKEADESYIYFLNCQKAVKIN